MRTWIDTRDPLAVAAQVRLDHRAMYPDVSDRGVGVSFRRAIDCFSGRRPGYQAIDARYHDLEHTLQGTLCLSAILRARHEAGAEPGVSAPLFGLCLQAILLHDTGYLKRDDDTEGTGAKYTATHVQRSCEFADQLLAAEGYDKASIRSVQNMIRCTGMGAEMASIRFGSEAERICGHALATADLLGQMAAPDYVEKLPVLFEEFAEAAAHGGTGLSGFESADDLMRRTPMFWERFVVPKIEGEFGGLYRFLDDPRGGNPYMDRIRSNLDRLRLRLELAA